MKTLTTLFTALLLLILATAATAQTYVNQAATGNNDGTSWADAYTELATALDNYSEGDEIWVAEGTYLPQQPSAWTDAPRQMFYIFQDVALYGGFDGTETILSERDPAANVTLLSGDLNGDDVDDDFEVNREDNALNVMVIDTPTTAATVIDGFTFEGGHADIDDDYLPNKRGGGIFTWGATQVRNCIFQQNYTIWHAGGIYFWQEGASGGRVENCVFRNNRCLEGGAGLFAAQILGEELVVESCQFENNEASFGGGAQVQNAFASFNNCQFTNNRATLVGGGMRLVYTETGAGNQSVSVTNCDFQGNSTGLTGGAIEYSSVSNAVDNSVTISNCQVTENSSANGGGFWYFSGGASGGNITIEACEFINNEAIVTSEDTIPSTAGIGFEYPTTSTTQNDTIRVVDCLIQDNTTEGVSGGLFYLHYGGVDNHLQMDNCAFIGNNAGPGNTAGGMAVAEGGENTSVLLRNTLFDGNTGPSAQGFGVSANAEIAPLEERQIELVNCLFTNHNNTGPETVVAGTDRAFTLNNCTFSENQGALLGTRGDGEITIRNNILQANGSPTYIAVGSTGGQPIRSLGGNLISDDAMDTWLTSTDQSDTDPLFEAGTFQPAANSPAVDAGVLLGPPTATDLDGNDRIQGGCIDIGAIESPHDAGTACQLPARRYVDQGATGTNDGSSWENAFTTLHDALEGYNTNDEIWVAEGTYLPQQPSAWTDGPKNTFYLYQDVRLYGGFNGTETMLSERDPAANVTILSGDLNGDDVDDDFEANRADNVINVLFLTADISPATIIDGFTIANGHADGDDSELYNQEGGGVWSLGSPQIKQCRFEQNYVIGFGGGLFFRGASSDESVVESCVFTRNRSVVSGGGMLIATFGGSGIISVTDCQFTENISEASGGGLFIQSSSIEMSNCQFTQNSALGVGGGMWCLNNSGSDHQTSITACTFEENTASNGGAFWMSSEAQGDCDITLTSCDFINNQAVIGLDTFPDGGALGFFYYDNNPQNDSIIITGCNFQGNSAELRGGGIAYFNSFGTDNLFVIEDCEFSENSAVLSGGGVYFVQFESGSSTGTQLALIDNEFDDNTAANGGGVAFIGNAGTEGEYLISECDFDGNEAIATTNDSIPDGGALLVQFSGADFEHNNFMIEDCDIVNNTSEDRGGGLVYGGSLGANNHFEMNDCSVRGNTASAAGGILIGEGGENNTVLVINTFFSDNSSPNSMAVGISRGATVSPAISSRTEMINCLFSDHDDDTGSGAVAIVTGAEVEATLTNCTFANNNASLLGTDFVFSGGQINLRNNILSSGDSPVYLSGAAGNTGTIQSLGGNLVTNATLDAFLNSTDQSGVDPLFEAGSFQLSQNSPAVDAGVLLDEPTVTDFAGNARIQGSCIDIGAYESPYDGGVAECLVFTNTREVLDDPSTINIFPNPTSGLANIGIENQWTGELELRIVNALGQVVHTATFEKYAEEAVVPFDAGRLPKGLYQVLVSDGQVMAVGSFIRL